jgi:flagellar biosynthesis GTPase FlhF
VEEKRKRLASAREQIALQNREKKSGFSRLLNIKSDEEKIQEAQMKKKEEDLSFKDLDEEDLKKVVKPYFLCYFFFFFFYFVYFFFFD